MPEEERRAIRGLDESAPFDLTEHLLSVLKAALATAPFCGGIASLMTDYIPSRRVKRLEQFANQVGQDLEALRERVEAGRINTEDYAFIFERCFRGAADFPQKEKLEAFRGILVNSALPTNLTQDQREFFLNLVERLSSVHLRILRFMADPRGYLASMEIPESRIMGGFSSFFPVALPGVPIDVIRAAFADLHALGFSNTSPDIFTTMTAGQGLQLLGDRLTPLARAFVSFCTVPA
ncbi:MAG TPA: hypothetical protein VMT45_06620 [Thermoanaerobaculaceae bacterium]|nr:hypothetical protein [Thermoanaerobaculaceae bacterium]